MLNENDLDYLAEYKDIFEHFAALSNIQNYQWIDKNGWIIDLRRERNLQHLKNIRDWMLKNSYRNTPYDDTRHFLYVEKKIKKLEHLESVVKKLLRQGV